jgi:uncharacterized protein
VKDGFKVIDSELHLMEPWELWDRLPDPYRTQTKVVPPSAGFITPGGHGIELNGEQVAVDLPPTRLVMQHGARRYPQVPQMARAATHCTPDVYVEGLDVEGIDVAVLSPTQTMALIRYDSLAPEHALAFCRTYNDWASAFTQAEPNRFKFWGLVPPHDARLAAGEARRCVQELGAVGVATIQGAINGHLWSDEFFDPLWAELDDLAVPFGLHISFSGQVKDDARGRYAGHRRGQFIANVMATGGFYAHTAVVELIAGGVLERYPNLTPVIMESGASWLPWLLWRLDEKWETFAEDLDYTLELKPSEYFRRQCYAVVECEEDVAKYVIDYMGDDHLLISTDYPHHDSPFPDGVKTFLGLEGISRESKRKILWDNGARLFGLESKSE